MEAGRHHGRRFGCLLKRYHAAQPVLIMKLDLLCQRFLLLLFVAGTLLLSSGCKTTEEDELSARPWNTPKSWEHGLPSSMLEGR